MNQREFEKLVEVLKAEALEKIQEGFMEWLGNRAFRGEELENGVIGIATEENQAQVEEIQGTGGGELL